MKHPLRLIIHAPQREKRDFRQTLIGLRHALCVSLDGAICTFDLLTAVRPRKGQEHQILLKIAEQLNQGWAICVWEADRFLYELKEIADAVGTERRTLKPAVDEAWRTISQADEEQVVDLQVFRKFPGGHYLSMVAAADNIDPDALSPRMRRWLRAERPLRPFAEDLWGVLCPLIMSKSEAELAGAAYVRWVKANRPRPPRDDFGNLLRLTVGLRADGK